MLKIIWLVKVTKRNQKEDKTEILHANYLLKIPTILNTEKVFLSSHPYWQITVRELKEMYELNKGRIQVTYYMLIWQKAHANWTVTASLQAETDRSWKCFQITNTLSASAWALNPAGLDLFILASSQEPPEARE